MRFYEFRLAEINGLNGKPGYIGISVGGQLGELYCTWVQGFTVTHAGLIRPKGFKFKRLHHTDDAQRLGFDLLRLGEIPSGVIMLMALRVDDQVRLAALALGAGGGGQNLCAADWAELHRFRKLPALRDGDGGTNTRVTAGTNAEGDDVDFCSISAALLKNFINEKERTGFQVISHHSGDGVCAIG